MVRASLVLLMAVAAPGDLRQVPAARVADAGPCSSAARSGETFTLACRQGVWLGEVGTLRLVLSCRAEEEHPNRVALLAPGLFVASGPCGLFLIGAGGGVRRLAGIAGPGLLAADGRGHAAVAADDGVWWIGPGTERVRVGGTASDILDDEEAPWQLGIGGGMLLVGDVHGRRLLAPHGGVRRVLSGTGRRALLSDGSLISVDVAGRVAVRTDGGVTAGRSAPGLGGVARLKGCTENGVSAERFALGLMGAERLEVLYGCGARAFAASDRRWFWGSGEGVVARGGLPDGAQLPVPVCPADEAAAPWLLADGILYRPVQAVTPAGKCRVPSIEPMIEAAWQAAGMPAVPDGAEWSGLLPRLDVRVAGSMAGSGRNGAGELRTVQRGARLAVAVQLVWNLDDLGRPPAASAREGLRLELRRRRRELRARLVRLLDAYRAGCGTDVAGLQDEILTRLDLITAGAFSSALSRCPPSR